MAKPMFIRNGDNNQIGVEYKCGFFPKIPNFNKRDSWFLLTNGVVDDIVVDSYTTVKDIRRGQYTWLVEIDRNPQGVKYTFDSNCREISYSFKVTLNANVSVKDPRKFYSNAQRINVDNFLHAIFTPKAKNITRQYSVLDDYNKVDLALTNELTARSVMEEGTGLSYLVTTVMVEPSEAAKGVLKRGDDMIIKQRLEDTAGSVAENNKGKSYADFIWAEAAQGKISNPDAKRLIEEYARKGTEEMRKDAEDKLAMLLKLRDQGIITGEDFSTSAKRIFFPPSAESPKLLDKKEVSDVSEFFKEGD